MLFYPNSQPPQDHSAKTRKRGQHDHGGKESPVLGDVRHIWSCVRELDPKRPNPVVILTPPPHKLRDLSRLVDTLSQVSTPDDVEMAEASLEQVPTTISSIAGTPGSRSGTPPADMSQLWEKANKALEELLATKSSINACRWKVVWELGMELHQNNSETGESIKETRAICTHVTLDAEALCSATVKEAKATCTHTIWEAKALLLHSH